MHGTYPCSITVCLGVQIHKLGKYSRGVETKPDAIPGKDGWAEFPSVQERLPGGGTAACKEDVAVFEKEALFYSLGGNKLMAFRDTKVVKVCDADVLDLVCFARDSPVRSTVVWLTDNKVSERGSATAMQFLVTALNNKLRV